MQSNTSGRQLPPLTIKEEKMKDRITAKIEQYIEELIQKPTLTQEEAGMLTYWLSKLERDEWRREMESRTSGAAGGGCCEL